MSIIGVNALFQLSKEARSNKDYVTERKYLEKALMLHSTNTKLINALIRNLRKQGDIPELMKWLEILYGLKPNGKILFELTQIEQRAGNLRRVRTLLVESERLSPNSRKIKRRIQRTDEKIREQAIRDTIFTLTKEEVTFIREARDIIYGSDDYVTKYNRLLSMMVEVPEEISLSIMAEFHKSVSSSVALTMVRKFKRNLSEEDSRKIKLANKISELVLSKKTRQYHWNEFWMNNVTICSEEKDLSKVFVKVASN